MLNWAGSDWVDKIKSKVKSEPFGHGEKGAGCKKKIRISHSVSVTYIRKTIQIFRVKFSVGETDHSDIY